MTPTIPAVETLAPLIDTIRDIAAEELPSPQTMEIRLWDDGDYRIYVFHAMGHDERKQIVYKPARGVVLWQHRKLGPKPEIPDPDDLSEGEERVIEQEYAIDDEREISTLDSPIE